MSDRDEEIDDKIFEESTTELVELNSSQETVEEIQNENEEQSDDEIQITHTVIVYSDEKAADEVLDHEDDQEVEDVEVEAIHRLKLQPSPQKRGGSRGQKRGEIDFNMNMNPCGSELPFVRLDRNEVEIYERNREREKESNKCQAQIDLEAVQKAIDRQAQLRVMERLAKAEKVARAKQTSKKGKYPKNLRKIVKKSSLNRAERSLAQPVDPEAPRTSTPKKVLLEDLQDGLRYCTQHCSSFFNRNGQPPLDEGTYPDYLSLDQARKEYRRNYRVAEGHPSLLGQLERPSMYDTDDDEGIEKEQADVEKDEDDLHIPTAEEIFDQVENPTPSTSRGIKARPVAAVFPMDKYGSLIGHGSNLFLQGSNLDTNIEAALEKLRRQTALKYALKTSKINATAALLARQGVLEDIEKYKDRIQYMTGKRRRILNILIRQQEMAEEAINNGVEPTLAQLGLTLEEAQEDFNEMQRAQEEDEEVQVVEQVEREPEVDEPEPEADVSHVSSNLSEPGLCDPQNPCSGDGPCRHMSNE